MPKLAYKKQNRAVAHASIAQEFNHNKKNPYQSLRPQYLYTLMINAGLLDLWSSVVQQGENCCFL